MWKILARALRPVEADSVPTDRPAGPVVLRFLQKYSQDGGATFNQGEIGGLPRPIAEQLIAEGLATRARPGAVSQVRPREDSTATYTLALRPATDPDTWTTSSDPGVTVFRWPPR